MKLKKLNKHLLTLMAAVMLLSAAIPPAGATTVVFHNQNPEQPDLFVHKSVTSLVDGYDAPKDDVFSFQLLLKDGSDDTAEYTAAKYIEYIVINSDGTEDKLPNAAIRRTDREGIFQLKADQTARFPFVGSGVNYQVIELEKDHYEQITPEGGPATGIVEANGAQVDFENQYIPPDEDVPPDKTPAFAPLTVTKRIRYPQGYPMPAAEAEREFSFMLSVDGAAFAVEPYDVLDQENQVVGHGVTDGDGKLTLQGGQTAKFTNIPVGVDYEVKELVNEAGLVLDGEGNPTGWYQVAASKTEGVTGTMLTAASFTNTNAAFLVSKKITGNAVDTDDSFLFWLLDGEGNPWNGPVGYYLYDEKAQLIDEELHSTGADGAFYLKGGQAALFVGIPVGTHYGVREERSGDYTQVFPEKPEGYVNMVVSTSVVTLPFENRKDDWKGSLIVQKTLNVMSDKKPAISHPFHFLLEEKLPGDSEWTVSAGRSCVIAQREYTLGENGIFQLEAGQTARFDNLPPNKLYRVSELWQEMEFGKEGGTYQSYFITAEDAVQETKMAEDKPTKLEFVNAYDEDAYQLHLTKTDEHGGVLAGAKFKLYQDEECTIPLRDGKQYVSAYNGVILIEGLRLGTYYLLETGAPSGYRLLGKPLKIVIEPSGITCDGQPISLVDRTIEFKVANWRDYGLPTTGAYYPAFIIVGLATAAVIAILVYNFKIYGRKNSENKKNRGKKR